MSSNDTILTMENITKTFGPVKALTDVNLSVDRGEIHAICGENGAGKSTLMNVLSGVYPYGSYSGKITFDGKECKYHGSVKPTLTYERGALIREEVQTFSLWPLLLNGYRYSKARGVHVQHQCSGCGS